jgi:hypothetical protein
MIRPTQLSTLITGETQMHHSAHKWAEDAKVVGDAERRETLAGSGALLRTLGR